MVDGPNGAKIMEMENPQIRPTAGVRIGTPNRASSASNPTISDNDTMGAIPASASRIMPSKLAVASSMLYSGANASQPASSSSGAVAPSTPPISAAQPK